jgi:hypothetical protein
MLTENKPEKKYPNPNRLLFWGVILLVITILLIGFAPKLITEHSWISINESEPNEIGDTLGGILGPIVGLIATALTFLAFWAQYDANIQQRKQFDTQILNEKLARKSEEEKILKDQEVQNKEFELRQKQFGDNQKQLEKSQELQQNQILLQDKRSRITLFETRFHTMLSIHRDNAINMEVNNIEGRKVFSHMLDELKFLYQIFYALNEGIKDENQKLSAENLYNVTYLSFFFGIGEKSTPMVKDLVTEKLADFVDQSHKLVSNQNKACASNDYVIFTIGNSQFQWKKVYSLGVGHLRRLGHYIRHLFQTVKFVDDYDSTLINLESKYNYISNLRAQLSAHEQVLLFYNAISVMGKPWLELAGDNNENYIERYCMLKSIPLNAADFYKKPSEMFKSKNANGKSMFEWTEIKERMEKLN